jgi:hypothetical protein
MAKATTAKAPKKVKKAVKAVKTAPAPKGQEQKKSWPRTARRDLGFY